MATFPTTLNYSTDSEEVWEDDLLTERAINGAARARALYPSKKRRFVVKFRLTRTERDTLQTFYDTNRNTTFSFVWGGDGVTYTCVFDGAPQFRYARPTLIDATVPMRQV